MAVREAAGHWASRYGVVLTLIFFVVLFSILLPDTFFTFGTFRTIISSRAILIILTLGLTIVLVVGAFDLSVGAVLGFSAALVVILNASWGWPILLAIVATLVIGVLVGLVNAFFVVRIGIDPFVTTLASGAILLGLTLAITGGRVVAGLDRGLVDFARAKVLGLPLLFFIGMILAACLWYVLEHTPLGRHMYFVGDVPESARLAGLPVDRIKVGAFVAAGVISAIAGILQAGILGLEDPSVGPQFLLPAFAGAFLGATTIHVGRFNAWGSVVGVYLLVVGVTGLQLLGAEAWTQQAFNGVALLAGVTFARLRSPDRS